MEIDPSVIIDDAIMQYHKNKRGPGFDSTGVPLSQLGTECDRQLFLGLRWILPPKEFDGQMCRLLETGEIQEERLLDSLEGVGAHVVRFDPQRPGKQMRVRDCGGHARGLLDSVATNVPGFEPGEWIIVECKSHNGKNFRAVMKHGLLKHKPDHYKQCQMYMDVLGYKKCLYMMVNKDNDAVKNIIVDHDPEFCAKERTRLNRIIYADNVPPKVSDDPDFFGCRFCDLKKVCHQGHFPKRRTCRSCIHVKALENGDYGAWQCTKHDVPLSLDKQKEGCQDHLFNPGMVPGVQSDYDAELDVVSYAMADGTTWHDGKPESVAIIEGGVQRYWHHPESGCVFITNGSEDPTNDGCAVELDITEYEELKKYYAEYVDPGARQISTNPENRNDTTAS